MRNKIFQPENIKKLVLLAKLKIKSLFKPRFREGTIQLGNYQVKYTDLLSIYVEYKDIFYHGIYQFESNKSQPVIIDGGGCIGMSVLYFKLIFPESKIICFEPDPMIFKVLEKNLAVNKIDDVILFNAGLAMDEGIVDFKSDSVDGGKIVGKEGSNTKVKTVRLSNYISNTIDFLKLNIEGQELPVLEEVERAGKLKNIEKMVIEYHGWPSSKQDLGELLRILDRNGFRYLVHDFDSETCKTSKPPFHLDSQTTWFCLIYAQRENIL